MTALEIQFPEKTAFLFEPHPYKCIYGGRGKSASWSFARALLILGRRRKLFIVCAREIQNSIQESVHKLISDQISELTYGVAQENYFYDVLKSEIVGKNGTKFVFVGIRNNVNSIKSMEAIDIFAVFEADGVSHNSWEKVLPTVRRDPPFGPFGWGSEVWVEFNPELETDETFTRFVTDPPKAKAEGYKAIKVAGGWNVLNTLEPDENKQLCWTASPNISEDEAIEEAVYHNSCVSVQMNYFDNPFFPSRLRAQMEDAKARDIDTYRNVWLGEPRRTLKGSIFAKELGLAIEEKRLSPHIKLDPTRPCVFSFDLGDSDECCWWAWQQIGMEHNAVDYYGNSGYGIDHYLNEIELRKLKVKAILLPHDAAQAHQSARGNKAGNTILKQVRSVYEDKVKLVPVVSVVNRINATRALFPRINISVGPTADGVKGLTHWRYSVSEKLVDGKPEKRSSIPLHNWASNPADGFTYYPVWLREGSTDERKPQQEQYRVSVNEYSQSWMG